MRYRLGLLSQSMAFILRLISLLQSGYLMSLSLGKKKFSWIFAFEGSNLCHVNV